MITLNHKEHNITYIYIKLNLIHISSSVKLQPMIESPSDIAKAALLANNALDKTGPMCGLAVVIPVYKEFRFGRIAILLEELDCQTVGRSRFETILVINNPGFRGNEADQKGFKDNLDLMEHIKKQKVQGRLDNVQVINCTGGELPARHIGLARGLGNEVAQLRLSQTETGTNGLIVQMDADASLDPDFLWRLNNIYEANPSAESAGIPRSPLPVDYTSDDLYAQLALQFLRTVIYLMNGRSPKAFNGSTLSFKAYLHQWPEMRSYMGYSLNEDYKLGENLYQGSRFIYTPEPRVFVADRRRLEGFDANLRCGMVSIQPPEPVGIQENMELYLAREEELARSRLDWSRVNQSLVRSGMLLFCQGRTAIGPSQVLKTYSD